MQQLLVHPEDSFRHMHNVPSEQLARNMHATGRFSPRSLGGWPYIAFLGPLDFRPYALWTRRPSGFVGPLDSRSLPNSPFVVSLSNHERTAHSLA